MKKNIRKIGFALLSFVFIQTAIFAQETSDGSTRYGILGGLAVSSFNGSNTKSTKMIGGFNIGAFVKAPIFGKVAIQSELYYATKGSTVTYNDVFVNGTAEFNLSYLELPVLLVFNVTDNLNVHFGPYVSYLLKGKVTNGSGIDLFDFEKNLTSDDYNRLDGGFAAGAAFDFGGLSLGARYNLGLATIGKNRTFFGTNSYTFPDAKNSVLNVYLSLSLN